VCGRLYQSFFEDAASFEPELELELTFCLVSLLLFFTDGVVDGRLQLSKELVSLKLGVCLTKSSKVAMGGRVPFLAMAVIAAGFVMEVSRAGNGDNLYGIFGKGFYCNN